MAAPTYGNDLTIYTDASSTTGWAQAVNMYVGGGPDVDTDLAIYGSQCISQDRANTGLASMVYTGTGPTLPTNGAFFIWQKFFAPNSLDTELNGGLRVLVGSTTGDYYGWYIDGSDTYSYGGWVNYAIDPTIGSPDQTQGTPSGVYNTVGIGWNCINQVKKGNPYNEDIIRYGRGESRFSNGDLANGYANFAGFANLNDNPTTGRWGLIQEISGGYLYKGLMSLGLISTPVDFRDQNTSITIDNTKKVSTNFNKIEINNISSNIEMNRISFVSLGTVSPGSLQVVDNATVKFDSCSFTDMTTFEFQSQTTGQTITFSRCQYVVQSGSTLDSCIFSNMSGSVALYIDNLNNINACDFISDGTGHAMELDSNHAGNSYTLTDFTYNGYGLTGTTDAVIYNNSGGHVKLTIDGGDTPTVLDGVGASTEFVTSVILSLTVKDTNGNPIQDAFAYIDQDNQSPFIMNTVTNSSGIATITWTGGEITTSTWRVRKYGYKPYSLVTNIPESGSKNIPVTLISDLVQT